MGLDRDVRDGEWVDAGIYPIARNIWPGDFIKFEVDGKFFGRKDGTDELYGGYVVSIAVGSDSGCISFSTSSWHNNFHSYSFRVTEERDQKTQRISEMDIRYIKKYRILND